jgi:hypothetical protein
MQDDDELRGCEVQSFRFQQIHDPVLEPQEYKKLRGLAEPAQHRRIYQKSRPAEQTDVCFLRRI